MSIKVHHRTDLLDIYAHQRERLDRKLANYEVDPDTGCWVWQGSCYQRTGYGQLCARTPAGKKVSLRTSRLMLAVHQNIEPLDKVVMHSCDNPPCINPEHLSLGTWKANSEDCSAKNRWNPPSAFDHYKAVLSPDAILAIRDLLPTHGNQEIINFLELSVAHTLISKIRNGHRYSEFTGITPRKGKIGRASHRRSQNSGGSPS